MKITIKVKLIGAFLAIFFMIIGMGAALYYFLELEQEAREEAMNNMDQIVFFVEKEVDHLTWINGLSNVFITEEKFTGQLDYEQCSFGKWYYETKKSPEFEALSTDFKNVFLKIEEPHQKLHMSAVDILATLDLGKETSRQEAIAIYQANTQKQMEMLRGLITELKKVIEIETSDAIAVADQRGKNTTQILISVSISVIIFGLVIAAVISRNITRPIYQVVQSLKEMAEQGGDLTRRIDVKSNDEVGELAHWFNEFITKLQTILKQVKGSLENVKTGTSEIATGNLDLSKRTEEQASTLEEISSTVQQITSSLHGSASNAEQANSLSNQTMKVVENGESVVLEMRDAMKNITQGSKEISEIIATVNDIAFQTNLLALNAAVEAARAGDQGRGFAVVAAEVRNLAGRSAEAAKEIEALIKQSITRVDKGNQLMEETEGVLVRIVENTTKTSHVISEIAATLNEQSLSADEIRTAIEELNMVTQQNASLVEEIASASENMNSQSIELSTLVGQFKVDNDGRNRLNIRTNPAVKPVLPSKKPVQKKLEDHDVHFDEKDFDRF